MVGVAPVLREQVRETSPLTGRVVPLRAGEVAARIAGPLDEIHVEVGDRVAQGDRIATLVAERLKWDREEKAAALQEAMGRVETAKARLAQAAQELRRIKELEKSAAFSKARYDDKVLEVARLRSEIAVSEASAQRARAALSLAETRLRYTVIEAPYDGVITRRHAEKGAFVGEGDRLFSMVSDSDFELEANVPAARVGDLAIGDKVRFRLTGNERFDAVIRAIIPEEDQRSRTWTVRFRPEFSAEPPRVAANQAATLYLPIGGQQTALTFPKDALITSRETPIVFVVEDGRARARPVTIGDGIGNRFEVLSGLDEGDLVVVLGNEALEDGKPVDIREPAL